MIKKDLNDDQGVAEDLQKALELKPEYDSEVYPERNQILKNSTNFFKLLLGFGVLSDKLRK